MRRVALIAVVAVAVLAITLVAARRAKSGASSTVSEPDSTATLLATHAERDDHPASRNDKFSGDHGLVDFDRHSQSGCSVGYDDAT